MEVKIFKEGNNQPIYSFMASNLQDVKACILYIAEKENAKDINLYKVPQLPALVKQQLLKEESSRIQKVLSQYGYFGLDDVRFWNSKDPEDPEPKGLLDWYEAYDNAIWDWIEKEFPKYQTIEELLRLDLKRIETGIFERTKSLLPQKEEE